MSVHSADSRDDGGEAVGAAPDSAHDESSLHLKQVEAQLVAAVTVPMDYSGDPKCIEADEEVADGVVVVVVPAASEKADVAVQIYSDVRFE
mmetsp:Transcript_15717/g.24426  ORF Transcript_15717/g.24426 Transcript_15717/m.24426 type:complete len:91 (+) Transcript_15717:558-830(+)